MTRPAKLLTALFLSAITLIVAPAFLNNPDGSPRITALPDPVAIAAIDTSGHADHGIIAVAQAPLEAERLEAERREAERLEAERLEAERLRRSASNVRTQTAPQSFDMPAECTGKPIPAYIVMRESRCNYGAVNQTGCSGYTCVGMYQFDLRHWIAKEDGGWGGCAHYGDWRIPENQDACASQMSRGGTYLAPWGG